MWNPRTVLAGIADAALGLVWAWLLGEFVATVCFASTRSASALGLLTLLLAPAALAIPVVRAVAHRAPLLAGVVAAAPWVDPVLPRAALLGVGFVAVSLALLDAALERPRPVADLWVVGVAALLGIRWCLGAGPPEPAVFVVAGLATAGIGLTRPTEARVAGSGRLLGGVAFGAATALVHTWFLGPTIVARWAGYGPMAGSAVIAALGVGFAVGPVIRANAAWLGLTGTALLVLADGPTSLVGGCVLAFAVPSLWSDALVVLARSGPRGVVSAAATHLGLLLIGGAAFLRDYDYGGSTYRPVVGWIAVGTAALAAQPGLGRAFGRERGTLTPGRFVAPVVALVLIAVRLWPRSPPPVATADVAMSWNIQQGFTDDGRVNVARVAATARSAGVTVLGLQESDGTRFTSAGRDLVSALADTLGMNAACAPGPFEATFGVALLSSHPIVDAAPVVVPSAGDHAVALLATLDVDGVPLHVVVTHLDGPPGYREAQSRAVAAAITGIEGPLLVLGDFDLEPEAPALATILDAGQLRNAATDRIPTRGEGWFDHVLWRGITVEPARSPDTGDISDHRPVVVGFTVR